MNIDEKSKNTIITLYEKGITLSRISTLSGATPAMIRTVLGQEYRRFPNTFVKEFTREWNAMREKYQKI